MVNESFGAIKDIKILNKEKEILDYFNKNRDKLEKNLFILMYSTKLQNYY